MTYHTKTEVQIYIQEHMQSDSMSRAMLAIKQI